MIDHIASVGYSYTGITNLKVVRAFIWNDNSCAYTISNGLVSSTDYSIISKVDSILDSLWTKTLPGLISKTGVKITNDENYLIFTPYSSSSCTVAKINASDGSFSVQKSISSSSKWLSLSLSSDNTYAYFSLVSVALSYVCRVLVSDLSMVDAKQHTSLNIVSIYSYGAYNVLINSIATLPSTYQITGVNMNTSSGSMQFGMKFGWTLLCSISTTYIFSLVSSSSSQSFQLVLESGKPVFFGVNLSTGSVSGSFYYSNLSKTSIFPSDIVYADTTSIIYILVRYSTGFTKFEYYPNTNTFSTGREITTIAWYWASAINGFSYFGGQYILSSDAQFSKILGNGDYSQDSLFIFSSTSDTFTVKTGYSLASDITIIISQSSGFSTSTGTLAFYNPGTYTTSGSESAYSDLIYDGGTQQTIYVQENYSGSISFKYPWSVSGSTSVSSSLISYPNQGTYPSWISLNIDYQHINIAAPVYGGVNIYYFGIRSVILSQNIDAYGIIEIYKCLVTNWISCSYSSTSTWNQWDTAYSLSSDASNWYLTPNSAPSSSSNNPSSTSSSSSTLPPATTSTSSSNSSFEVPQISSTVVSSIVAGSVGVSALTSALFQSGSQSIWSIINNYQLIYLLPYLNTYLDTEVLVLMRGFQITTLNLSFLNSISNFLLPVKQMFNYPQPNELFLTNGLESGSFIINEINLLFVYLLIMTAHLCFLVIYIIWKKQNTQKLLKLMNILFYYFNFKVYILMILQSYVFGFLGSLSEVSYVGSIRSNSFSFCTSLIFTLFYVLLPVFVLVYQLKKKSRTSKYFGAFYSELKANYLSKIYNSYFMIRRIVIVFIITFMFDTRSWWRLVVYAAFQCFALVYVVTVRPMRGTADNFVVILNDVFYFTIWSMMLVWEEISINQSYLKVRAKSFSIAIFYTIILNSLTVWIFSIIQFLVKTYIFLKKKRYWNKWCWRKRKVLSKIKKYYNLHLDNPEVSIISNKHFDFKIICYLAIGKLMKRLKWYCSTKPQQNNMDWFLLKRTFYKKKRYVRYFSFNIDLDTGLPNFVNSQRGSESLRSSVQTMKNENIKLNRCISKFY